MGRPTPRTWPARMFPYLTEHTERFGAYSTHELGIEPVV